MKYIDTLWGKVERQKEVIDELKEALQSLADYANSPKYYVTPAEPQPTMNPADIVCRVRDWQARVADIELNGKDVTDGCGSISGKPNR